MGAFHPQKSPGEEPVWDTFEMAWSARNATRLQPDNWRGVLVRRRYLAQAIADAAYVDDEFDIAQTL